MKHANVIKKKEYVNIFQEIKLCAYSLNKHYVEGVQKLNKKQLNERK